LVVIEELSEKETETEIRRIGVGKTLGNGAVYGWDGVFCRSVGTEVPAVLYPSFPFSLLKLSSPERLPCGDVGVGGTHTARWFGSSGGRNDAASGQKGTKAPRETCGLCRLLDQASQLEVHG
jgi:hypothetical protein